MGQVNGGLDIAKLRGMQKDINKKAGDGDDLFLFSNKLPEELDIRILPPPEIMKGVYFLEQEGWWIKGKFVISNSTEILGGTDVIQQEIDAARDSGDPELKALIEAKKDNIPLIKKEIRYLVPILQLKAEYDDNENLIDVKVEAPRVLVAKPTLLKSLNSVVTGRPFQNGTKAGIADREKGFNIIIGKRGKGLDTEYYAMGWTQSTVIDEKHYDEKVVPNVYELTKKVAKSDEHLRSVIRNYLYGEDIIEDAKPEGDTPAEEKKSARPATNKANPRPSAANAKGNKESEEAVKEEPKKEGPVKRSLLDDAAKSLEDL